jgi:hypothetical protein
VLVYFLESFFMPELGSDDEEVVNNPQDEDIEDLDVALDYSHILDVQDYGHGSVQSVAPTTETGVNATPQATLQGSHTVKAPHDPIARSLQAVKIVTAEERRVSV